MSVTIFTGACAIAMLVEAPYHRWPKVPALGAAHLYVVGDSLSAAGIGEQPEDTWPQVLARRHGIHVVNRSQPGATVGSSLERMQYADGSGVVTLLEIGGNDILGRTPVAEFEANLDRLLQRASSASELVLMVELPLPPLHGAYGRVQRRLARKYDVVLIPKRPLARLVMDPAATTDGLHLSPAGHERSAATIGELSAPAFSPSDPA